MPKPGQENVGAQEERAARDGRRIRIRVESSGIAAFREIHGEPDDLALLQRGLRIALEMPTRPPCLLLPLRVERLADRLQITEPFLDGFSLGAVAGPLKELASVNLILSLAHDVAQALAAIHAVGDQDGRLVHGEVDSHRMVLTDDARLWLVGFSGRRGEAVYDVDGVMAFVRGALTSRSQTAEGRALVERLGSLRFGSAADLRDALQIFLKRHDPQALERRRYELVAALQSKFPGGPSADLPFLTPDDIDSIDISAELRAAAIDESDALSVVPPDLDPEATQETVPADLELELGEAIAAAAAAVPDAPPAPPELDRLDEWSKAIEKWEPGEAEPPEGFVSPWDQTPQFGAGPVPSRTGDSTKPEDADDDEDETVHIKPKSDPESVREGVLAPAAPRKRESGVEAVLVGDYRVVASIGRGGMGEIYLARSLTEERVGPLVALKVLGADESDDDDALGMFMDEAAIMARIDHPNVLRVIDFGKAHGRYFLATEYLEGRSLVRLMVEAYEREGKLDYPVIAAIGADAAYGLQAAHRATKLDGTPLEIVHRDISPQNIFVGYSGVSKVIDFGVARASERISKTEIGLVKGKAAYMSPEQTEGRPVDARSDIFSLGICLWEMTAGRRLFKRKKDYDTLLAVQVADIEPPSVVRGDPNPVLDHIILGALARDADKRIDSARELAAQLVEFCIHSGVHDRNLAVAEVLARLFGESADQERALIRDLEERTATPSEVARLRELSGVSQHDGKNEITLIGEAESLDRLDNFGAEPVQKPPASTPENRPVKGIEGIPKEETQSQVLEAVERLKLERTASLAEGTPDFEPISSIPSDQIELSEDALFDETPVDQPPEVAASSSPTPIDQTPVDQTPIDQTPIDQTPAVQASPPTERQESEVTQPELESDPVPAGPPQPDVFPALPDEAIVAIPLDRRATKLTQPKGSTPPRPSVGDAEEIDIEVHDEELMDSGPFEPLVRATGSADSAPDQTRPVEAKRSRGFGWVIPVLIAGALAVLVGFGVVYLYPRLTGEPTSVDVHLEGAQRDPQLGAIDDPGGTDPGGALTATGTIDAPPPASVDTTAEVDPPVSVDAGAELDPGAAADSTPTEDPRAAPDPALARPDASAVAAVAPSTPLPPVSRTGSATTSFSALQKELKKNGIALSRSEGTYLLGLGAGPPVILDASGTVTRVEQNKATGFLIESRKPSKTAVTWVGHLGDKRWFARGLSVNDCRARARVTSSAFKVTYGKHTVTLPRGGGALYDVSILVPEAAIGLRVEPLGLGLGEGVDAPAPCASGWWGARVVLRRIPAGRYRLKWRSATDADDAPLVVSKSGVEGGKFIRRHLPFSSSSTTSRR